MLIKWFFAYKSLPNLLFRVLCLPGDQSHPVCATDNKPSCVLHLLDWFIGSRGIPSLEQRPEFWVLHKRLLVSRLQLPSAVILEPPKIKPVTVSIVSYLFAMKGWDQIAMIFVF